MCIRDRVKGADELIAGTADTLEGFNVLDDYTFTITLKEPYAGFLACLSVPGCSIYNREATEAAGDQFGLDPALTIGTGPFKFTSWTINDLSLIHIYLRSKTQGRGNYSMFFERYEQVPKSVQEKVIAAQKGNKYAFCSRKVSSSYPAVLPPDKQE